MIDVPRRGIACLDSQIEKINRTRPTLRVTMGRLQPELIRADPPPSPTRLCSCPRPPWLFLVAEGMDAVASLTLAAL